MNLKFGSVAMDVPAVMHKRLVPLTKYLSARLNKQVTLKLARNMPEAIRDVADGTVQLAYLTPVAYIKSRRTGNTQLIAKTITKGKASFRLMIVVRDKSPYYKLSDLHGKSFAFGDPAALLQRAVVVGAGLPLEKLGRVKYLGHYDNIVRAVLRRDFDAGILKDTMAYKWEGKGIRIIHASEDLPPYNIAAAGNLDKKLVMRLKRAFFDLNINKKSHLAIIKALDRKYDGFSETSDAEYDVVRRLIAPFSQKDKP